MVGDTGEGTPLPRSCTGVTPLQPHCSRPKGCLGCPAAMGERILQGC